MKIHVLLLTFFLLSTLAKANEVCGSVKSFRPEITSPSGHKMSWKVEFKDGKTIQNIVPGLLVNSFFSEISELISIAFDAAINASLQGLFGGESEQNSNSFRDKILICFTPAKEVHKFSGVSRGS